MQKLKKKQEDRTFEIFNLARLSFYIYIASFTFRLFLLLLHRIGIKHLPPVHFCRCPIEAVKFFLLVALFVRF
jgi:hypothetical protein